MSGNEGDADSPRVPQRPPLSHAGGRVPSRVSRSRERTLAVPSSLQRTPGAKAAQFIAGDDESSPSSSRSSSSGRSTVCLSLLEWVNCQTPSSQSSSAESILDDSPPDDNPHNTKRGSSYTRGSPQSSLVKKCSLWKKYLTHQLDDDSGRTRPRGASSPRRATSPRRARHTTPDGATGTVWAKKTSATGVCPDNFSPPASLRVPSATSPLDFATPQDSQYLPLRLQRPSVEKPAARTFSDKASKIAQQSSIAASGSRQRPSSPLILATSRPSRKAPTRRAGTTDFKADDDAAAPSSSRSSSHRRSPEWQSLAKWAMCEVSSSQSSSDESLVDDNPQCTKGGSSYSRLPPQRPRSAPAVKKDSLWNRSSSLHPQNPHHQQPREHRSRAEKPASKTISDAEQPCCAATGPRERRAWTLILPTRRPSQKASTRRAEASQFEADDDEASITSSLASSSQRSSFWEMLAQREMWDSPSSKYSSGEPVLDDESLDDNTQDAENGSGYSRVSPERALSPLGCKDGHKREPRSDNTLKSGLANDHARELPLGAHSPRRSALHRAVSDSTESPQSRGGEVSLPRASVRPQGQSVFWMSALGISKPQDSLHLPLREQRREAEKPASKTKPDATS